MNQNKSLSSSHYSVFENQDSERSGSDGVRLALAPTYRPRFRTPAQDPRRKAIAVLSTSSGLSRVVTQTTPSATAKDLASRLRAGPLQSKATLERAPQDHRCGAISKPSCAPRPVRSSALTLPPAVADRIIDSNTRCSSPNRLAGQNVRPFLLREFSRQPTVFMGGPTMQLETFPQSMPVNSRRTASPEQRFELICSVWEARLVAEAYDLLSAPGLIISDGLAYLTDRVLRDCGYDGFVRIDNPADDHSDVFIAVYLLEDLREGCALLSRAVRDSASWEEAFLGFATPRIHEASSELIRTTCRRICESF